MFRSFIFAVLLALTIVPASAGEKLARVEIGKRGKAATAFVDVPGRGSGTAFCVHPSGLFVTNEHVVRGADKADVTLVLDPALPTQRVLMAKVVRMDKDTDLALLRAEGAKDLPTLTPGSIDGVAELMDVVACGFPLGRSLSTDRKEYPAISVNAGTVTALRHMDRELQFIQIDVALTFGNSGGPVLNDEAKVVGVVVSGVVGAKGINQAIPVSKLARFLQAPDVSFAPLAIAPADLTKPLEFKARAASLVPGSPEPTLQLVLKAGDEEPRTFPMTKRGGEWVATAAPVAKGADAQVELSARFTSGTITGLVADSVISVGGKPQRLGSVRKIESNPPRVMLADGKILEGAIIGLNAIEISIGGQTVKLDLSKAMQVTVLPDSGAMTVTAIVVALVGGKEVARVESTVPIHNLTTIAAADPSRVIITPPVLADERVVKRLSNTFTDVVLGGGGRYLIFHMPKLKKLAVFDMTEARVTKYIPLSEDKIAFASGLESVIVGLPQAGLLERWNLSTGEREKSAPVPFKDEIKSMQMGHGSNGPVVVNGSFLDPATFRKLPITDEKGNEGGIGVGYRIPSADGTVYGAWNTHLSPDSATTFVLEGNVVQRYEESGLRHVAPGPDGREVFTGKGVASNTLKRGDNDDATYGYCLPAVRGDFFLSLHSSRGAKGSIVVYLRGLKVPLGKLDNIDEHWLAFDGWDRESFGPWKRVFFVPDAKVIAVLPESNDQVVLYKFDADAALEKSGQDYLLVTSRPPATAVKSGNTFSYTVAIKVKTGGATFKLDAGPAGMDVSPAGVVTWKVPAGTTPGDHDVILTIRDAAGQEVFHTFVVRVVK